MPKLLGINDVASCLAAGRLSRLLVFSRAYARPLSNRTSDRGFAGIERHPSLA